MRCEHCREALSARLDNEEPPRSRAAVDSHQLRCGDCRQWLDDASRVTRLARMSVVTTVPGVGDEVLAGAPRPGRARLAASLRAVLAVLGGSQLLLGLVQMTAYLPATHHGSGPVGGSAHLWHESAAWNVAIGAGFVWIAVHRTRPSALLPVLTAFVGLLSLLSISDLGAGRVEPTRLLSHALVVAGYLIMLALGRPGLDPGGTPTGRDGDAPRWRVRFNDADRTPTPPRRAVPGHPAHQWARGDRAA